MLATILSILLAYLLGSVSGSLLLGALRNVDIRKAGSGNAGGTNAFRTQGFWFALGVVVIDVGKGALAAGFIPHLSFPGLNQGPNPAMLSVFCGFAAVVGHSFPVWHGFRGGKGAATAVGTLCIIQPLSLISIVLVWVLVLGLSGWVGLATMVAGLSLIPAFVYLDEPPAQLAYAVALAVFLLFTHRQNVRKMFRGEEYRFDKAMFRNWFS